MFIRIGAFKGRGIILKFCWEGAVHKVTDQAINNINPPHESLLHIYHDGHLVGNNHNLPFIERKYHVDENTYWCSRIYQTDKYLTLVSATQSENISGESAKATLYRPCTDGSAISTLNSEIGKGRKIIVTGKRVIHSGLSISTKYQQSRLDKIRKYVMSIITAR